MPQTPDLSRSSKVSPTSLPEVGEQCRLLAELLRPQMEKDFLLVGIHSGGAWIAERLAQLLAMPKGSVGSLDISFYRDDYAEKGLHTQVKPSAIGFEITGRHVILVDDVLYTGRTTRAALNETFDYGRPASVELAVLADRGGRELPITANYCVWQVSLPPEAQLVLACEGNEALRWKLKNA